MSKMIVRAAPGATGPLHLGSLYNVLLNYVFGKRDDGVFFLRLDAPYKTGASIRFEREIEDTIRLFGLIPDFVVKQSERKEIYREQVENVLNYPNVYFCQCSNDDITKRFYEGTRGHIIDRHDKYPPPCSIKRIKIYNGSKPIEQDAKITASTTAPGGFEIENTLAEGKFWKPYNSWYYGDIPPIITFTWAEKVLIDTVQISWLKYPAKTIKIFVNDKQVAKFKLKHDYWDSHLNTKNTISFKGIIGQKLTIVPVEYLKVIQKEYAYDGCCKDRKLKLQLDNSQTFVRKECDDFVDVLLWNGEKRKVDLAFRSAIDDKEFGVTNVIRGSDIKVFAKLEEQCGKLINYFPNNYFHSLILYPNGYKYAKSTGSRDVMWYVRQGIDPDSILSCLAWKTGVILERKKMKLNDLVRSACLQQLGTHKIIDENDFVNECLSLKE